MVVHGRLGPARVDQVALVLLVVRGELRGLVTRALLAEAASLEQLLRLLLARGVLGRVRLLEVVVLLRATGQAVVHGALVALLTVSTWVRVAHLLLDGLGRAHPLDRIGARELDRWRG